MTNNIEIKGDSVEIADLFENWLAENCKELSNEQVISIGRELNDFIDFLQNK